MRIPYYPKKALFKCRLAVGDITTKSSNVPTDAHSLPRRASLARTPLANAMGVNDPYDPYGLAPVPPPLGDRGDVPSTRRRRRDLFDDESSHHADLEDKAALVQ